MTGLAGGAAAQAEAVIAANAALSERADHYKQRPIRS